MAISWSKTASAIIHTRKKSYGYLYCVKIDMPGAFVLSIKPRKNIPYDSEFVYTQIDFLYERSRYWHRRPLIEKPSEVASSNLLKVKEAITGFKFRTEYNELRLYSDDEHELLRVTKKVLKISSHYSNVVFFKPDPEVLALITNDCEIVFKVDSAFTHRVNMVDQKVGVAVKQQILGYLQNLGDTISITDANIKRLNNNSPWLYGVWFRTKDETIISFIQLIAPGAIRKIIPIVRIDK